MAPLVPLYVRCYTKWFKKKKSIYVTPCFSSVRNLTAFQMNSIIKLFISDYLIKIFYHWSIFFFCIIVHKVATKSHMIAIYCIFNYAHTHFYTHTGKWKRTHDIYNIDNINRCALKVDNKKMYKTNSYSIYNNDIFK